ncbi:MAG: chromosome segregation protein SMC [Candidatus Kapaibacteriales bacterium]
MYLSDLELHGFKSFGLKTKLKFTDGLTCVVGPNGCGKTNIVDGLRWVLGEQRSSVIRSEVMENVIFNGNSKRKPLGMAEVIMTIQNNKGVLPTEYSEVEITRRLFRDGESNYLINGKRCRLKDIHELFMDTGMGANSYSVIELKMVEAILSGKTEDRRQLLEEAAGVVRFKTRRKEAMRKLSNVKDDLERLNDIESEVGKQVNSLQRQAAKTRRYNEYNRELTGIELQVMARDISALKSASLENDKQMKSALESIMKHEIKLTEKERLIASIESGRDAIQIELAEMRGNKEKLKSQISENDKQRAVLNENNKAVEISIERIKKETENSDSIRNNAERSLAAAEDRKKRFELSYTETEKELAQLREQDKLAKEDLQKKRDIENSIADKKGTLESSLVSSKALISRYEKRIEDINSNITKSGEQIEAFDSEELRLESEIVRIGKKKDELSNNILVSEKWIADKTVEKELLNQKRREHQESLSSVKSEKNSAQATLRYLESLTDSDETAKFIKKSNKADGLGAQLIELFSVEESLKPALLAALGNYSKYYIANSANTADSIIELLKNNKKGKAGFIIESNTNADKNNSDNKLHNVIDDGLTYLADKVKSYDSGLEQIQSQILDGCYVAESSEEAQKAISKTSDNSIKVITKDGIVYQANGIIYGGSESSDLALVGKKENIKKAESEIAELESKTQKLESEISNLQTQISSIDIDSENRKVRELKEQLRKTEEELGQLKNKRDSLGNRREFVKDSIEKYENEIEEINAEVASIKSGISEAEKTISELAEKLELAKTDSQHSEEKLQNFSAKLREAELHAVQMEGERKTAEKDIYRLQRSLQDIAVRIRTGKEEIDELENRQIKNASSLEELSIDIEEYHKELEECEISIKTSEQELKEIRDTLKLEEEETRRLRKADEAAKQEKHKLEIEKTTIEGRIGQIKERAEENHSTDIEAVEIVDSDDFDIEDSRKKISDLKQKLQNIGSVNFMALQEYEETKERHDFLTKQISDLVDSEKNLLETIENINIKAEELFVETFGRVRENFKMLFNSLFEGDADADLELKGDNPLESDLVITARPPGKKPHSIEMLSGGEKTLTAISLLFAIYMEKPSPFCILDEVDAPLDDANIGRFVSLLKRFSEQTQFLIVTHNKKTMEAADNLYGVTQEEKGLSKIVSVKIDGKEQKAA